MLADSSQMENFPIYNLVNASTSVLWIGPFLAEGGQVMLYYFHVL